MKNKLSGLVISVVKKVDPKTGFGSDPNAPWIKDNIDENITSRRSDLLKQFYKAMGYNMTYVTKNQRVAKAKTGQFIKWKREHGIYEEDLTTQTDHPEIRSHVADSPTKKRQAQLNRAARHYDIPAASAPHSNGLRKESGEICQQCLSDPCICDDSHGFIEEKDMGISKASETKFHAKLDKLVHKTFGKRENESTMYDNPRTKINTPDMTEGVGDPKAGSYQPGVTPGPDGWSVEPPEMIGHKKTAAKIIKNIVNEKKRLQKEELDDWEKRDKEPGTKIDGYGKKPSFSKSDDDKNIGDKKPDAELILKGGTTLTGEKRDVIEINPMMKKRETVPDYNSKNNINQSQK